MLKARKATMVWGEKSKIVLIGYRYNSIEIEVRAAFRRRQAKQHFGAQLDIGMYGFVHKSSAPSAKF